MKEEMRKFWVVALPLTNGGGATTLATIPGDWHVILLMLHSQHQDEVAHQNYISQNHAYWCQLFCHALLWESHSYGCC